MDKDMNKLIFGMIKYDLITGLFVFFSIGLGHEFLYAKIYMFGICVALMNFVCSCYVTSKFLNNATVYLLLSILRITLILLTIMPLIKDHVYMSFYMTGFVSHYIILVIFGIKNGKGSV